MTPSDLHEMLSVLRQHGVVSAEVPAPDGGVLRVVFAPEVGAALPPGQELTPGGWKSPPKLDRDPLDDERSVP